MTERYWWIICQSEGKPLLIAGGATENEARTKALDMLSGVDFELKDLPTRNLARASSILRGKRLEDTHDLKRASQRIGHSKTLRRMMDRKLRNRI